MTGGFTGMGGCFAPVKASAKNSKNTGLRMAKISQRGESRTIISQRIALTSKVYP